MPGCLPGAGPCCGQRDCLATVLPPALSQEWFDTLAAAAARLPLSRWASSSSRSCACVMLAGTAGTSWTPEGGWEFRESLPSRELVPAPPAITIC